MNKACSIHTPTVLVSSTDVVVASLASKCCIFIFFLHQPGICSASSRWMHYGLYDQFFIYYCVFLFAVRSVFHILCGSVRWSRRFPWSASWSSSLLRRRESMYVTKNPYQVGFYRYSFSSLYCSSLLFDCCDSNSKNDNKNEEENNWNNVVMI